MKSYKQIENGLATTIARSSRERKPRSLIMKSQSYTFSLPWPSAVRPHNTFLWGQYQPSGLWPKKIRWNLSLSTEKLHKWLCGAAVGCWVNQRLYWCVLVRPPWLSHPKAYPQARKQPGHQSNELPYSLVQQKSKKQRPEKQAAWSSSGRSHQHKLLPANLQEDEASCVRVSVANFTA